MDAYRFPFVSMQSYTDDDWLYIGLQIARFIAHYERLTRHILSEMPARADMVAWLNQDRSAKAIELR